jgi:hypothetical protein
LCDDASSKVLTITFALYYAPDKTVSDVQVGGRVATATLSTAKEVRVLAKQRSDRLMELEERHAGYEVYDRDG